jgi:hypothetical protein
MVRTIVQQDLTIGPSLNKDKYHSISLLTLSNLNLPTFSIYKTSEHLQSFSASTTRMSYYIPPGSEMSPYALFNEENMVPYDPAQEDAALYYLSQTYACGSPLNATPPAYPEDHEPAMPCKAGKDTEKPCKACGPTKKQDPQPKAPRISAELRAGAHFMSITFSVFVITFFTSEFFVKPIQKN